MIQNRSITKVGDTKTIPIDIRLICATNMDLAKMVSEGQFREDLYYRINTVSLQLPPLRERTDEIVPLSEKDAFRLRLRCRITTRALNEVVVRSWRYGARRRKAAIPI